MACNTPQEESGRSLKDTLAPRPQRHLVGRTYPETRLTPGFPGDQVIQFLSGRVCPELRSDHPKRYFGNLWLEARRLECLSLSLLALGVAAARTGEAAAGDGQQQDGG
jgi:hypothetical protein